MSVGAGLSLTTGNTNTKSYNLATTIQYDPKTKNTVALDGFYLRTQTEGQATVDKAAFGARDLYRLSTRAFAFGEIRYLRDRFKAISALVTPLAGVGLDLVKTDTVNLALELGVGGAFESDHSLDNVSSGSYHAGEAFTWKISRSAALSQKATGLWRTRAAADALYHVEVALTSSIAKHAEIKFAFIEDYRRRLPEPSSKKHDEALLFTLVMKL